MTSDELEQKAQELCPHCKRAAQPGTVTHTLRFREDTQEWTHNFVSGPGFSHSYCAASELRKANG